MPSAPLAGRIAFFGGSFDPPHLGHVAIARAARAALDLDRILFAPVGAQPLKPQGSSASFEDRLAMTRLAVAGEAGFEASAIDAPHGADARPNYTFDTLRRLRAELAPGAALFCLMGADAFFGLRQWYRAVDLPFAAPFIVASRPGQPLDQLPAALPEGLHLHPLERRRSGGIEVRTFTVSDTGGRHAPFYLLPGLDMEISATDIRAQLVAGPEAAAKLLPDPVAAYIQAHHLYR